MISIYYICIIIIFNYPYFIVINLFIYKLFLYNYEWTS